MTKTGAPADPTPRANPPMGYSGLAWLAEAADGRRDVDLVIALVTGPDGTTTPVLETKREADDSGHTTVLEGIRVSSTLPPKVTPVEQILIKLQGEKDPRAATFENHTCDAVFSTDSAVQKFLVPYYHAQRILDEDGWTALNDAIKDPHAPAIGHVYPSRSGAIGTGAHLRVLAHAYDEAKLAAGTKESMGMRWMRLEEYGKQRQKIRKGRP